MAATVATVIMTTTLSCSNPQPCGSELSMVKSGAGVAAVLCDSTPDAFGATVSTLYVLHILAAGESPSDSTKVLTATYLPQSPIKWRNDSVLDVNVAGARIYYFRNLWQPPDAKSAADTVRIVLIGQEAST